MGSSTTLLREWGNIMSWGYNCAPTCSAAQSCSERTRGGRSASTLCPSPHGQHRVTLAPSSPAPPHMLPLDTSFLKAGIMPQLSSFLCSSTGLISNHCMLIEFILNLWLTCPFSTFILSNSAFRLEMEARTKGRNVSNHLFIFFSFFFPLKCPQRSQRYTVEESALSQTVPENWYYN